MATGAAANNLDLYQVNCTFYDALGRRDNEYLIMFFTCVAAVVGPLAMGAISDRFGNPKYDLVLATVFATMLFGGFLLNRTLDPARDRLQRLDHSEYESSQTQAVGAQARS
jgi:hypothetical protein